MQKTKLAAGALFHESLAEKWQDGYERRTFRRRLEFIEMRLKGLVEPGAFWLDVGCGSGILTRSLRLMGAVGYGIDGSPAMIEMANRLHRSVVADSFTFQVTPTVECLSWPSATFDGVLCSSVLEYLERPSDALVEFARVLRPSGRLFLTAARTGSVLRGVQSVLRRAGAVVGRDVCSYLSVSINTYSERQLRFAMEQAGLRIDAIESFDPILPVWAGRTLPSSLICVTATRLASQGYSDVKSGA